MTEMNLYGRVLIHGDIEAVTGLHIGGSSVGLEIGGVDKAVIRNPFDGRPYIPGSSLRGKMRSQTEKVLGLTQNNHIGKVTIHTCERVDDYLNDGGCPVCHIYGVPAQPDVSGPTRLAVRDVPLNEVSAQQLDRAKTDLRYAELKTEVAIDRVTSAASPRTMERVPAGAVFGPAELVFGVYDPADFERLKWVVEALQLVEDDYLGGSGSRGSGKVRFRNLQISARNSEAYGKLLNFKDDEFRFPSVQALVDNFSELVEWLRGVIPTG